MATDVTSFYAIFRVSTFYLFFYLLFLTVGLWYVYYRISRKEMYKLAKKIQGPDGLPFFGVALDFLFLDPHKIYFEFMRRSQFYEPYKPIKIWLGPRLGIFLTDPNDIEVILSSNVYIDKSPEYRFFKPWLGNGLLISTGEKWKIHRKLIAPTFHLNVLKSFITLFNIHSINTVNKLKKLGNKEFDIHDYMSECTVEILLETAMGVTKKTQKNGGFEYAHAVMKMCDILHLRHTRLWLRPDIIFNFTKYRKEQTRLLNIIHDLTNNVLAKKKKDYYDINKTDKETVSEIVSITHESHDIDKNSLSENIPYGNSFGQSAGLKDDLDVEDDIIGEKKRVAFLDLLIECAENGVVLSDKEVREQVDTIMFEGHDTTAAGSSFFLCLMGEYLDIQEKVVEELYSIFGDSDRPVTFQDTLEMKFLERCIMETLRLYPPVPIIGRQLYENVKLVNGTILPLGASIAIGTLKLHRDPVVFPNPDVFNPDHFLPERTASRHYYAYIPFSAGPRSCVGRKYAMLKLKIILATILRNFKVYSTIPENKWKIQGDIILKRSDGFKIRLEPRKSLVNTNV
ncbi:cytochrome P450 4g15-like [Daktulosphaira vitifoliae]|uniref:cytochrome P450 4g15-like n=1 Tax=Daktulosphaira vitifoliae TaxID=58002 RepID=UPI0021A9BE85|nr:cytochrome P450 4g15-like [Daktulosphaira vitifoliae]XP_050528840.1 cytochrome P450 4g15-like [Daktulosphaira vitifoliae]